MVFVAQADCIYHRGGNPRKPKCTLNGCRSNETYGTDPYENDFAFVSAQDLILDFDI